MSILLAFAFIFAGLESLALYKNWFKLEWLAKPAVMLCLLLWLVSSAGFEGAPLWFGLGILFSLAGDVLLMLSLERNFLAGLAAFLIAHIFYVIGFNLPLPGVSAWSVILAILIGWGGARILRRIFAALLEKGKSRLRLPLILYGVVVSLMLLSALMKLDDLSWNAGAAVLAGVGAFLFYLSDIILAWNKFVAPMPNGRIYNIAVYHLGQILLIAGAVTQFGK